MTLIIYRKRQTNVFSYRMTLHGVLLKSDIVRLSTLAGGDKPRPYCLMPESVPVLAGGDKPRPYCLMPESVSALAGGDKPRPYAPASLGDEGIGPINIAVS